MLQAGAARRGQRKKAKKFCLPFRHHRNVPLGDRKVSSRHGHADTHWLLAALRTMTLRRSPASGLVYFSRHSILAARCSKTISLLAQVLTCVHPFEDSVMLPHRGPQAEELALRSAWCRQYAAVNAAALRKVTSRLVPVWSLLHHCDVSTD